MTEQTIMKMYTEIYVVFLHEGWSPDKAVELAKAEVKRRIL